MTEMRAIETKNPLGCQKNHCPIIFCIVSGRVEKKVIALASFVEIMTTLSNSKLQLANAWSHSHNISVFKSLSLQKMVLQLKDMCLSRLDLSFIRNYITSYGPLIWPEYAIFWPSLSPPADPVNFFWSKMACRGVPHIVLHVSGWIRTSGGYFRPSEVRFRGILGQNTPIPL